MILRSTFNVLVPVELPPFQGRQHYMHGFDAADPVMHHGPRQSHSLS